MKKLGMLALAAVLVAMFTMPAWAIESEFGGYWRTRFYTTQNFTGEDESEAGDFSGVDTRTRLYYTAIFHENLKFVNKFEWDAIWGTGPLGDIGADGKEFEIKNSYVDFNTGPVNWKVGIQGAVFARGFLFDDDFSGVMVNYKGETFELPFVWVKAYEGTELSFNNAQDANDLDADYFGIFPKFTLGGMFDVNPYFMYIYSKDASEWFGTGAGNHSLLANALGAEAEELNMWYAGLDLDVDFDMGAAWFTGIYQGGDVDLQTGESLDFKAWLLALGGNVNVGMFDVHGRAFYASGDDDDDEDIEQFTPPQGRSYYWSEIMGYGIFDFTTSNNAPADNISNVWAANLGVAVKPMDKLKVALDVWYAALAEKIEVAGGGEEDVLGTEVDLVITYEVVENLNLDLVGAYLFAGDATTENLDNDENPYEVGARLSLAF
ncbi:MULTISPECIES: alginate export family protein [Desulfococcus]|jgi:hypothetical protein|uniref:Uncharacterized protein n=1 Tax=Desulfococcus multivorans DSM 2059 TaxID=1121405 RepID=S7UYD7_DESML|nr:alginate export family protein [Desulfococcus multivorans]AQV02424.1 hypothetical protein B2D07_17735 [Desulfococcus multivorans]EPR39244.1 protein of unknown function DUF4104 [Desulfococcus multivorans DSM 2059]MDX9819484.1 alginate export family protein [Desulfococcus multivorans]SJZ58691.1 Alginate export [Desulfococcus multivorans DSM 2059]